MALSKGSEHSGHRERQRRKFIRNGLDGFEPHEALELYLYYAIPRRDTNPLAHRLLDRYLTLAGVCDAPIDELMNEFGMSESTAVLLKLLPDMSRLYNESRLSKDYIIPFEHVGEMMKIKFIGRTTEVVVLMLGDAKGKMIFFDVIAKGSINSSDMPIRKIVDLSLRHNAKLVYLAHNHPSGSAVPSSDDISATRTIYHTLRSVGVKLMDHIIVADNDFVSLKQSGIGKDIFG